jgi:hypothetical protein
MVPTRVASTGEPMDTDSCAAVAYDSEVRPALPAADEPITPSMIVLW